MISRVIPADYASSQRGLPCAPYLTPYRGNLLSPEYVRPQRDAPDPTLLGFLPASAALYLVSPQCEFCVQVIWAPGRGRFATPLPVSARAASFSYKSAPSTLVSRLVSNHRLWARGRPPPGHVLLCPWAPGDRAGSLVSRPPPVGTWHTRFRWFVILVLRLVPPSRAGARARSWPIPIQPRRHSGAAAEPDHSHRARP